MKCFTQLKKSLAAFCALLLASGVWASVTSTCSVTTNGVTWTFSVKDGQAVLEIYTTDNGRTFYPVVPASTKGVLEIPSSLNGHPVSIGDQAFWRCSQLTEVIIPATVVNIGHQAFCGCTSLISIRIPNSVTSIESGAFMGCSALLDVPVPQCVCKSRMAYVFPSSYSSMTNVVVSDGVTCIGTNCFADCTALRTVTIPASVTSIDSRAFSNCTSLEKIVFLGNAPDMGEEVFFGTPRTMAVEVPQGSIGWSGGVSGELPAAFGDRGIVYSSDAGSESGGDDGAGGGDGGSGSGSGSGGGAGGGNGGGSGAGDARYELADAPRDRAIASMVVDGDVSLDAFDLSDGRVFDAAVRIVNVAGRSVKVSLPAGFAYEKFRGTSPLVLPAASTNLLTITRVGESTFFVSRGELVAEDAR